MKWYIDESFRPNVSLETREKTLKQLLEKSVLKHFNLLLSEQIEDYTESITRTLIKCQSPIEQIFFVTLERMKQSSFWHKTSFPEDLIADVMLDYGIYYEEEYRIYPQFEVFDKRGNFLLVLYE
ncbi:MAG: hypothetical protein ACE5KJ_04435 [Candidatus Zixiibacteriota bacterium]